MDTDTGELSERRLGHGEQAEQFYRERKHQDLAVRVGMESSGHSRWFERLLRELQFELFIRDGAEIRTKRIRKQNGSAVRDAAVVAAKGGESLSADLGARR